MYLKVSPLTVEDTSSLVSVTTPSSTSRRKSVAPFAFLGLPSSLHTRHMYMYDRQSTRPTPHAATTQKSHTTTSKRQNSQGLARLGLDLLPERLQPRVDGRRRDLAARHVHQAAGAELQKADVPDLPLCVCVCVCVCVSSHARGGVVRCVVCVERRMLYTVLCYDDLPAAFFLFVSI